MNSPQIPSPPFQIPVDPDIFSLHLSNGAFTVEGRRVTAEGFASYRRVAFSGDSDDRSSHHPAICSDTGSRTCLPFPRHVDTADYEQ